MFRAESQDDGYTLTWDSTDYLVDAIQAEVAKGHGFGTRVQVTVEVVPVGEGEKN